MLKMAMVGGGAVLAGLLTNSLSAAAAASPAEQATQAAVEKATTGMKIPVIKDVSVITVAPGGFPHQVVKVTTDQPGLHGYGDASAMGLGAGGKLLEPYVEQYIKRFAVNKPVDRIEQLWQMLYTGQYFKNDHIMMCGIAGVCDALWDINGRLANMPVHRLVGGKCREAADTYVGASGVDPRTFVDNSKKAVAAGYRNIKYLMFGRTGAVKTESGQEKFDDGAMPMDRDQAMRTVYAALELFRKELPKEIKLIVDVHMELDGKHAVQFCKDCEQFGPWCYMEDLVPAEEADHFKVIRQHTTLPLALGEVWSNSHEWIGLVQDRQIDFLRHHVSHIGGFTAARKIAAFAETYQVAFAWHGVPKSPVGMVTDITLDLTCENFGVHEGNFPDWPNVVYDIYKGDVSRARNGYMHIDSDKPGWGIEIDEELAKKNSNYTDNPTLTRTPDGAYVTGTGG
jgi:mannonate dehydratase